MRYPCCKCCCGTGKAEDGYLISGGCRGVTDMAHHTEPCPNQPISEEETHGTTG